MPAATNTVVIIGSAEVIVEYMEIAMNSVLFQRGVYPHHRFKLHQTAYSIKTYMLESGKGEHLKTGLEQLKDGITRGKVNEVSLSIKSVKTNETVERWNFKIEIKRSRKFQRNVGKKGAALVIRQILTFVATMPALNYLAYHELSCSHDETWPMPVGWHHSVSDVIPNSRRVGFSAFSTDLHEIQTEVEYIEAEDDPSFTQSIDSDSDYQQFEPPRASSIN